MRVLVIGGTRFIGPPTVERLAGRGHEVTVFHRGETEVDLPPGVRRIKGDRRRLQDYAEELRRLAPEVVLDVIPMNEHDARGALETFRHASRRVVAISSQDVYRAYDIVRRRQPGPPDPPRWAEWVRRIGHAAGWSGGIPEVPKDLLPKDPLSGLNPHQHWLADTTPIRRELDYSEVTPREEALRRTVAWEREHPPENIDPENFDYAAEDAALETLRKRPG